MTKLNSFCKEFVALVKGDDAEAKAQKVWRKAESALKTQIASLSGDAITKEDAVDTAKENLAKALINHGEMIENRDVYVQNLIKAKNELTVAEKKLEEHKALEEFLKNQYDVLSKE